MLCNPSTLYRAIREDFPAIKLRARYVVPAKTIDNLVQQATIDGGCVDIAALTAQRADTPIGQIGSPEQNAR